MPHVPQESVNPMRKKSCKKGSTKNTSKVMDGGPDHVQGLNKGRSGG